MSDTPEGTGMRILGKDLGRKLHLLSDIQGSDFDEARIWHTIGIRPQRSSTVAYCHRFHHQPLP